MAKNRKPRQRQAGLTGKHKAQIAVAVVTTLPQLIWVIVALINALR